MSAPSVHSSLVPRWLVEHRRLIVWFVGVVLAAMAIFGLALGLAARPGTQPFAPQHPVVFVGSGTVIVAYGLVFAVLVQRVAENLVGWIFGSFALVMGILNVAWAYVTYATETVPPQLPGVEVVVLVGAMLVPLSTFLLVALVIVFPEGRPPSRAWGRLIVAAGILALATSLALGLSAGALPAWSMESPMALPRPAGEWLAGAGRVMLGGLALMIIPAVWSLTLRYRAAGDVGRLQLKWFVYAGSVFAVCTLAFWLLVGTAYQPGSGGSTATWLLVCFGASVVPLAASVAILRYHLYDIETIIGRTLVYGGLTAILAGIYTAAIRLFNWIFVEMTGEDSDAALVLTTLVLATTFTPIKAWLEGKVAARRGVIADPSRPVTSAGISADADVERIAERAAEIVLRRLGRDGTSASQAPAGAPPPSPQPGRATLE